MPRLLAVNVGLPKDISWRGRTVHTAIWKAPVAGRCAVRQLNLDGDGQGDRAGHGGEQRAVLAYQIGSYRHWERTLGRNDFGYGQFGENLTIDGLADDEVAIGDRYRIGNALFEVTQPRVTCYRLGIRLDEPRMAALLTGSGRPGFYLRVLGEGTVAAGDEIVKVAAAAERMTVAEASALLYLPDHPRAALERALRIPALSPGWRGSFQALLDAPAGQTGNAGLVAAIAGSPARPGFRRLRAAEIHRESDDVIALTLEPADGQALAPALPGQFVVLRLRPAGAAAPLLRSYSLAGPPSRERYRLGVKLEPHGVAGTYLHDQVRAGDVLEVSGPRGSFFLAAGDGPVVLASAGVGVTPVLAMLHALAAEASPRPVFWVHGARNGRAHAFADEARRLVTALPRGRRHVRFSQPDATDRLGHDHDASGHVTAAVLDELHIPPGADFYLCGPAAFMRELGAGLAHRGLEQARIHTEIFAGTAPSTPGIASGPVRPPHPPAGPPGTGALVAMARSGIAVRWDPTAYQSLLELAEACDVPVRWSCRTGVCHSCESGLLAGRVAYEPEPLDAPAEGSVLLCCCRPTEDVVVDL